MGALGGKTISGAELLKMEDTELLSITFTDGTKLSATARHKTGADGEVHSWTEVKIGDEIISSS